MENKIKAAEKAKGPDDLEVPKKLEKMSEKKQIVTKLQELVEGDLCCLKELVDKDIKSLF